MSKLVFCLVLLSACSSSIDDILLGCFTFDNEEVCAYCDDWDLISFEGMDSFNEPFALCSDWCAVSHEGKNLEGCKDYLDSKNTGG